MRQEEKEFILENGETEHRQCAGNHSDTLYMNEKNTIVAKANIKTDAFREGNKAQLTVN